MKRQRNLRSDSATLFLPFISRVKVSMFASTSELNVLFGLKVTESAINLSRF